VPALSRPLVSGLKQVQFTVQDITSGVPQQNLYWQNPGGGWNTSSPSTWTALTADSFADWYSTNVPNAQWNQGHTYVVTAWATDNALPAPGNVQTPVSNYFTFDSSAPLVSPIGLQNGAFYASIASITGTAQDYPLSPLSCAGVKQIQVLIMRHSDNAYWLGGGSWGVIPSTWPIIVPTGNKTEDLT